jgi:hypothetical protein
MLGVIAKPYRPVFAIRSTQSPRGRTAAKSTILAVVAFGLCAVYIRCRSLSPLDRAFHHHLDPGYRFSGRYVLAGSTGESRDAHGSNRMAGSTTTGHQPIATDAGPH